MITIGDVCDASPFFFWFIDLQLESTETNFKKLKATFEQEKVDKLY